MRIKQKIQFNKIVKDLQYNLMERLKNKRNFRIVILKVFNN